MNLTAAWGLSIYLKGVFLGIKPWIFFPMFAVNIFILTDIHCAGCFNSTENALSNVWQ